MSSAEEDQALAPNNTYFYDTILTDGFSRYMMAQETEFEYLYIPIISGLSIISSIIISSIFLKKTMISPTSILLIGIAISRSVNGFIASGTNIFKYLAYSDDVVYSLPYPFCIIYFAIARLKNTLGDFARCLVFFVALQRLLVVRWPFESRMFLTNRVSLLVLLVSSVISICYNLPEIIATGSDFTTFKSYVEGKGLDVDNYISHEYYYYYYYYYDDDDVKETSTNYDNTIYDVTTMPPLESSSSILRSTLWPPVVTSSSPGTSYDYKETWMTEAQKEMLYNECIYRQDTTAGEAKRLYHVIFFVIYLISIATFTIFLILHLRNRGLADSRHEAKGRVKKMMILNISVVMLLVLEFIRGVFTNSLLFITYLVYVGVYELPSTREGLDAFVYVFTARDIIVALSSFITMWIYIVSCSQFRMELKKLFLCAFCQTKKKFPILTKETKST